MQEHFYDYLIIGGDAAGLSAITQIRKRDSNSKIAVLEKGPYISYGACGIPYVISGQISGFDSLIHYTPQKFQVQYKCDIFMETEAISLDSTKNLVLARSGQEDIHFRFGTCMVATGAEPVRLSITAKNSNRIFYLKNIVDGKFIQDTIAGIPTSRIALLGSGYIGLEMAEAFTELGHKCVLFDIEKLPVPRMDENIGKKILKKLTEKGIEFYPEKRIRDVREENGTIFLETDNESFQSDYLLIALGVKPSTSFLSESGIALSKGAIETDRFGRTSINNIYSGGDCSMVYHRLLKENVYMPLGSTANKQGRIAGMNMAGESTEFPGIIGTQIFKFFDLAIGSTGITPEQGEKKGLPIVKASSIRTNSAGYMPEANKLEVSLYINKETDKIVGGHFIGPLKSSGVIDTIGVMAQMEMSAKDASWFDAAYAPPFAPVWNAVISAAGKYKE